MLQVSEEPVQFDAHVFHCTLPWLGSRLMVIGFHAKGPFVLEKEDTDSLLCMGFPLPGSGQTLPRAIPGPESEPSTCLQSEEAGVQGPQTQILTFGFHHTEVEEPHMHAVLQSKRLQMLDEIIATDGYDDMNLASDIRRGFDLVRTSPVPNVLPGKVSPASLHPDDVCDAATRANEELQTSLGSSGDHATDV